MRASEGPRWTRAVNARSGRLHETVKSGVKEWGRVLLLAAAAFLLRIYQIDRQELWFDEATSYYFATIMGAIAHENTPPLYYLLLRAWMAVAGTDETAIRLLSALFGTVFVLAILWAGRTFFNAAAGWWSGLFSTFAPIHIYYSQEARAYVLATLLVLLTYVLLWRAMERMTPRSWLLASAAALLALHTHYLTFFALLPAALLVNLWPHLTECGDAGSPLAALSCSAVSSFSHGSSGALSSPVIR